MKKLLKVMWCFGLVACIATGCGGSGSVSDSGKSTTEIQGADNNAVNSAGLDDGSIDETGDVSDEGKNAEISKNNENSDNTVRQDKLIYTCNMVIDTTEYEKSIKDFKELVKKHGGFVESENEQDNAENQYFEGSEYREEVMYTEKHYSYHASVRIPSKNYDSFVGDTGNIGDVRKKVANVENVSKQYYDLSAELEVLQAKYDRFMDMMKKADNVNDILQIENNLTNVETRINQIKTDLNSYDNDVAYSHINVDITQVKVYTPKEEESFLKKVVKTMKESLITFRDFIQKLVLAIIHVFPFLIFFGAIAFIGIKLALRHDKKVKEKSKMLKKQKEEKKM